MNFFDRLQKISPWILSKPGLGALFTAGCFLTHPLRFTDEVIRGELSNRTKPLRFLIEVYVLTLLISSVVSWSILTQPPSEISLLRKVYFIGGGPLYIASLFLGGGVLVHLCLSRGLLPIRSCFHFFCYLQGSVVAAKQIYGFIPWIQLLKILSIRPDQHLVHLLYFSTLLSVVFFLAYSLPTIARVYKPRWYRMLFTIFVVFVASGAVSIGFLQWASSSGQPS